MKKTTEGSVKSAAAKAKRETPLRKVISADAVAKTTKRIKPIAHGVGRRKSSVARVWLRPGNGKFMVNGSKMQEYFTTDIERLQASIPLSLVPSAKSYDVQANVNGGGLMGQADAIKLGISRAFLEVDPALRPVLKEQGLLTVDARVKERKKYGRKAARRRFQFVKR